MWNSSIVSGLFGSVNITPRMNELPPPTLYEAEENQAEDVIGCAAATVPVIADSTMRDFDDEE